MQLHSFANIIHELASLKYFLLHYTVLSTHVFLVQFFRIMQFSQLWWIACEARAFHRNVASTHIYCYK